MLADAFEEDAEGDAHEAAEDAHGEDESEDVDYGEEGGVFAAPGDGAEGPHVVEDEPDVGEDVEGGEGEGAEDGGEEAVDDAADVGEHEGDDQACGSEDEEVKVGEGGAGVAEVGDLALGQEALRIEAVVRLD